MCILYAVSVWPEYSGAVYNMTASHGMAKAKEAYAALETKAEACQACHHCEKECPQHIKISEIMPKIVKTFA